MLHVVVSTWRVFWVLGRVHAIIKIFIDLYFLRVKAEQARLFSLEKKNLKGNHLTVHKYLNAVCTEGTVQYYTEL